MSIDLDRVILIVTGAHLRSEVGDRPLAYGLRERMVSWLQTRGLGGDLPAERVVVCSDVWYLNQAELRTRPTISIGGPGVNALSAFLGDKLPTAFAIEDVLLVQVDLDFVDIIACCWGMNHATTVSSVEAFVERYLEDFLLAATRDWT